MPSCPRQISETVITRREQILAYRDERGLLLADSPLTPPGSTSYTFYRFRRGMVRCGPRPRF